MPVARSARPSASQAQFSRTHAVARGVDSPRTLPASGPISAAEIANVPAREDALRAKDAGHSGDNQRAKAPVKAVKMNAPLVGQEKLSCISDNGRFRHRR